VAACEGNVTSPERETTPLSSRLMDVACIAGSRLAASRLEPGERSPSLSLSLSPSLPPPGSPRSPEESVRRTGELPAPIRGGAREKSRRERNFTAAGASADSPPPPTARP